MEYIIYFLEQKDFSTNSDYADYKEMLEEVKEINGDSRFEDKEEAVIRVRELKKIYPKSKFVILEVY